MAEAITLTDATLDDTLKGEKPVMLLITNGEGLRGDFTTAFKKAAAANGDIVFARLDPAQNPEAARRFEAGSKPLLLGLCGGETITRRFRPWGPDVDATIQALKDSRSAPAGTQDAAAEKATPATPTTDQPTSSKENMLMPDNKPVDVTDANFQQEVIDYHLPVVVDFWAEWCGPCRMVAPVLEKLAGEYAGKIRIAKVNVDENPGLSQTFRVMSIPTIMMLKERNIVFSQPGALPEPALRDLFEQLIALEIPPQDETEAEAETSGENAN